MARTQINSEDVLDGGIKNADIATDAAIAISKLAGSASTIVGTKSAGGMVNLTPAEAKAILNYIENPMTTAGDIIYGGTSGTPTRLAKGTAGQLLAMNAGATAPEWKTVSLPSNYLISAANDFAISNNADIKSAGAIVGSATLPAGTYMINGTMKYLIGVGGYKLRVTSGSESNVMTWIKEAISTITGQAVKTILVDQSTYIIDAQFTYGTITNKGEVSGKFTLGAEATVNLRFSQYSSNATASILYANSFIYFTKIA